RRVVVLALADRAIADERLRTCGLDAGALQARLLLREDRPRLRQRNLEGSALDAVHRRPGADRLALAKELLLEDARNARAHLDLARPLGARHRLEHDRHPLGPDLEHVDLERRRRAGRAAGGG